jgi:hypothetical protein
MLLPFVFFDCHTGTSTQTACPPPTQDNAEANGMVFDKQSKSCNLGDPKKQKTSSPLSDERAEPLIISAASKLFFPSS